MTTCACGAVIPQLARGRRRRWCSERCRKSMQRALPCPEMHVEREAEIEALRARRALPCAAFANFAELDAWLEGQGR